MILYQPQQGLSNFKYSEENSLVRLYSYLTIWVGDGETLSAVHKSKDPNGPNYFLDFYLEEQDPDLVSHPEDRIVKLDLIQKAVVGEGMTGDEKKDYVRINHIKPDLDQYDNSPGQNIVTEYRIIARVYKGSNLKGKETNLISEDDSIDIVS